MTLRAEILAAAAALRAAGIGPGDRVAIVGLNSTRYLALDVAIGLVGAGLRSALLHQSAG